MNNTKIIVENQFQTIHSKLEILNRNDLQSIINTKQKTSVFYSKFQQTVQIGIRLLWNLVIYPIHKIDEYINLFVYYIIYQYKIVII